MKHFDRFARAEGSGGNPAKRVMLALVLLGSGLIGSGTVPALAAGTPTTPNSGGFSGGGGDDETVGTLPSHTGGPTFDVLRFARLNRPSVYVQGGVDEVLSAAVVVRGDRRVLAQAMPNGELRLIFLGTTQVGFDRNAFHSASLQVGVVVPANSTILRSGAAWNGHSIGSWTYVYELPVAQFEANGLLDQAPVLAGVTTTQGSTTVRAQASPDLVTLSQVR